jgi:hypothetical protein
VEPLGPPRLIPVEPPGHLRPLLAIHRDEREALGRRFFLQVEERLAVGMGRKSKGNCEVS